MLLYNRAASMGDGRAPEIGASVSFDVTVDRHAVQTFADLSGDHALMHVDEGFMAATTFGRRIAHGALLVAYMSCASTMMAGADGDVDPEGFPLSLGFDRIRFLAPVFLDDVISVHYQIVEFDEQVDRSSADIRMSNQDGALVAVATHLMKWVGSKSSAPRSEGALA